MKKRIHLDSMAVRILAVVLAGILVSILAISVIIISLSKKIFIDTYGKSQEQVFTRIEEELNGFHEDLMKITDAINESWYLKIYLQNEIKDPKLAFQAAYKTKTDMERAIPADRNDVSIVALSKEGKSYVNKAEKITTPVQKIMNSRAAEEAMEHPEDVSYVYLTEGYTSTTQNGPAIMMIRALTSPNGNVPYGILMVLMKEEEVAKYYEYFISANSEFYIVNQENVIVSSSEKDKLNTEMEESFSAMHTVLEKELPYYRFSVYGIIDNEKALGSLYNIPQLWILCAVIMGITSFLVFLLVRQTTNPLSRLVEKMSNARIANYDEYIEPVGTKEVKELSVTYNAMLKDLNRYIEELMMIQKEKRKAEISALQMQINPHYIYNTLASIKWLIYQGNEEKSTKTIDAFISLLRNTIGNTDEYITVEQEIENLKNYVLINNTRYGDKIAVEYFVSFGCEECKIPKMILQPFVENAFFHAFPYERRGSIQIFIRQMEGDLRIQIMDDGVGINKNRLDEIAEKSSAREHFSGIGINNVDDRLKLIYGERYGIMIESEENQGTAITIRIPAEE